MSNVIQVLATAEGLIHLVVHPITIVLSPRDAEQVGHALLHASSDALQIEAQDDGAAPADVAAELESQLAALGLTPQR